MIHRVPNRAAAALLLLAALALPARAHAHCDTMVGPVVQAGRAALEHDDVTRALIWVQPADEPTLRQAFRQTMEVRALGPGAQALAERWFFETLVRLHRAGEGEPFTGLKEAADLGPAIPAADRALATGDLAPLTRLLVEATRKNLNERFQAAWAAKRHARADVAAGREYVECYVEFMHRAEAIWQAATGAPASHDPASAPAEHHPGAGE